MKVGQQTSEGFVRNFKPGMPAYFFECKTAEKVFDEWVEEYKAFITLQHDVRVTDVTKEGNTIVSIRLNDDAPVSADMFVDCSYEGDLFVKAGVAYALGREAKDRYNEAHAGIRFQRDTLFGTTVDASGNRLPFFKEKEGFVEGGASGCVNAYNFRCVLTKNQSNLVPFYQPEGYASDDYDALADFLKRNPDTKLNRLFGIIPRGDKYGFNTCQDGASSITAGLLGMHCGYPAADYATRDSIVAYYRNYNKGLFCFLSNDERVPDSLRMEMATFGYAKDEFVDNDNFPYYFYVREGYRMQSDFVFTENDILENRAKDDAILLGSHWLDCHSIQRIALSDTSYIKEGNIWEKIKKPYEIPYRVMLPKEQECNNLLVPVAVSASHVGFCSIRLESTWMQLGHAAGTAIVQAMETGTSLHAIDMPTLQQSLRSEGMLVKLDEFDAAMAKIKAEREKRRKEMEEKE